MPVGHRGTVAGLVLAVSLAACGLLDTDRDLADCDVVRVAFDDALWRVSEEEGRPADGAEGDPEPPVSDTDTLRRAVDLHDGRRDCFDDGVGDFLDPAREVLGDEHPGLPEFDPPFDDDMDAPPGGTFGEPPPDPGTD